VVDARTYVVQGVIDTGPITNHVTLAGPGGGTRLGGASAGDFAYVTVCADNVVKVFRRDRSPVTSIPVGACPHGVWSSGDGTRVYVGLQEGDGVDVIDTRSNRKIAEIPMGQSPQALVYVPNAVPSGAGLEGLVPLASQRRAVRLDLVTTSTTGRGRGTVDVRALGPIDGVDVSVTGLEPGATYTLYITGRANDGSRSDWPLATIVTDGSGNAPLVEAVSAARLPIAGGALGAGYRLVLVKGSDPGGPIVLGSR
jgi:YVTN family beta-propeller protein